MSPLLEASIVDHRSASGGRADHGVLIFGSDPSESELGPIAGGPGSGVGGSTDAPSVVRVPCAEMSTVQLSRQFGLCVISRRSWESVSDWDKQLVVHNMAVHLAPGATMLSDAPDLQDYALACGLEQVLDEALDRAQKASVGIADTWDQVLVFRRTQRTTIHDLVAEARSNLRRLTPTELHALQRTDPDLVVLDTRTPTDRQRFGAIPGSVHTPRTTLEWMIDPASGYSLEMIHSFDQPLVVVCNEGYSSSLSAAALQRLGFVNATDLVRGVMGWRAAGLPLEPPDHTAIGCSAAVNARRGPTGLA